MIIPSLFRSSSLVLILIGFMLLGLTRRAVAGTFSECTYYGLPAPYTSVPEFFDSIGEAGDACVSDAAALGKSCQGPYDCTYPHSGCENQTPGYINYWIRVGYVNYEYLFCAVEGGGDSGNCPDERAVLETECGSLGYTIDEATCQGHCNTDGGECAAERADAESECGGADLYVIDEQTCEWHCDDSQDCPDSDSDGAADVCDPCPDNPDISEEAVEIYRLNGDSMSEKCAEATMSCDGSINVEGNTGTICQPVDPPEVKVTECRAVRGSGAVCKADKDTDGDGTYDTDDEDDDNDGTPDSEDTDDDGDGIPDDEDPDHEDYSDYDGDGIPDSKDTDDDNDGTPDGQDPCPKNSDPNCEDSDGDGIPDSEDPDDDDDGTPDSEDEDDDGDGIPDADELNPFSEPPPFTFEFDVSSLFQKYLDRFSQFLTSMRQTSVFSIPDQVLGGIPSSGGSPVVTISTGETFGGDHEIDFSGWASGLAVIRGVLYAIFTALAVRIIILKR